MSVKDVVVKKLELNKLRELADAGDADGQFQLGRWYFVARTPWPTTHQEHNLQKALEWFSLAAAQGHKEAKVYLDKGRKGSAAFEKSFRDDDTKFSQVYGPVNHEEDKGHHLNEHLSMLSKLRNISGLYFIKPGIHVEYFDSDSAVTEPEQFFKKNSGKILYAYVFYHYEYNDFWTSNISYRIAIYSSEEQRSSKHIPYCDSGNDGVHYGGGKVCEGIYLDIPASELN